MLDKIIEIVAEQFNQDIEDLSIDTNIIEDLNADSLEMTDLIMTIEDEFEVEITDEELENIKTIRDILDCLESR